MDFSEEEILAQIPLRPFKNFQWGSKLQFKQRRSIVFWMCVIVCPWGSWVGKSQDSNVDRHFRPDLVLLAQSNTEACLVHWGARSRPVILHNQRFTVRVLLLLLSELQVLPAATAPTVPYQPCSIIRTIDTNCLRCLPSTRSQHTTTRSFTVSSPSSAKPIAMGSDTPKLPPSPRAFPLLILFITLHLYRQQASEGR
jgi:hypothetical protein